jgi:hypothetical protein
MPAFDDAGRAKAADAVAWPDPDEPRKKIRYRSQEVRMKSKRVNELLWIGLTGMLIIGTSFAVDVYRAVWGDHTIWWTHQSIVCRLKKPRIILRFTSEETSAKAPVRKNLFFADKRAKQFPVVSGTLTVRLNNWEKTKASS